MSNKIPFLKKCWRTLLKKYYSFEQKTLKEPKKLKRFKRFCTTLPICRKKVVIDSYYGKGYGDNAKYIVEELLRRSNKYKIIWLVNSTNYSFPKNVVPVLKFSLRAYYESATAKAWIFNTRSCRLTEKRNQQIYLQTWHGGIPMKKIEMDAEDKLSKNYVSAAKEDGRVSDGILAEGVYIENIYKRAFWLNNNCEILRFGSPRADILCKKNEATIILRKKVRTKLGIDKNAYVILYAPTFRNNRSTDVYIADLNDVKKAFSLHHNNVVMLVRLHPNVSSTATNLKYSFSNDLINVTYYDDPQELVVASDCGITDYSSMIYDFALMRKPGFLCMKDLNAFSSERGLYDLFYDQPFKMNFREEDLIEEIIYFDENDYQRKLDIFFEKYPTYNKGNATKQTVDWLIRKGL